MKSKKEIQIRRKRKIKKKTKAGSFKRSTKSTNLS